MPEAKVGGEVKKFSYTRAGRKAAKRFKVSAIKRDSMVDEMEARFKANRMKPKKSHYGKV
mgnify:CR=1 FL=1